MDQYTDAAWIAPLEDGESVAAVEYLLEEAETETPDEFYDDDRAIRVSYGVQDNTIDLRDCYHQRGHLPIDGDSLEESYAVKALAGDPDVHGRNIQVTDDGASYPHDFEAAGTVSLESMYHRITGMITGKSLLGPSFMTTTQLRLGIGLEGRLSPGGFRDKLDQIAGSIDRDHLNEAYQDDERIEFDPANIDDPDTPAEQIMANLEAAENRSYTNKVDDLYDTVRNTLMSHHPDH